MRISDWSSDVCSSDLRGPLPLSRQYLPIAAGRGRGARGFRGGGNRRDARFGRHRRLACRPPTRCPCAGRGAAARGRYRHALRAPVDAWDFRRFDLILAADETNLRDARALAPDDARAELRLMLVLEIGRAHV